MSEQKVYEIKTYTDKLSKSVVKFINASDPNDFEFMGTANIATRDAEFTVNFPFPPEVKTEIEAFDKFKDALDAHILKVRQEQSNKIITPADKGNIII